MNVCLIQLFKKKIIHLLLLTLQYGIYIPILVFVSQIHHGQQRLNLKDVSVVVLRTGLVCCA